MLGYAGSSLALFAVVWSLLCMVSSALVTDAMLRDGRSTLSYDVDGTAAAGAPRPGDLVD